MSYQIILARDFLQMPWKNGGGITREIMRFPEAGDNWQWRISVAEIARDGEFSRFENCHRSLTLLSGAGMRLVFNDRHVELIPHYSSIEFSGEEKLHAELIDGVTTDFNAIWKSENYELQVARRAMHGSLWCIAEEKTTWLVYLLSGSCTIKSEASSPQIQAGDAIYLQPNKHSGRLILEAFGEALWVKIIAR